MIHVLSVNGMGDEPLEDAITCILKNKKVYFLHDRIFLTFAEDVTLLCLNIIK